MGLAINLQKRWYIVEKRVQPFDRKKWKHHSTSLWFYSMKYEWLNRMDGYNIL